MRKLYLHIGTHRTATSSTQAFLQANATELAARGWLYPYGAKRHNKLFNDLFAGKKAVADVAADLDRRAAGRETEIHSILLSDEDISIRSDLSVLAGFTDTFEVKVVYCLRRQDLWLESWYLQNIKWQWNPALSHATLDEFLEKRELFFWADYDAYLKHVEQVFGPGSAMVYVFEKEQMPQGPVARFCEVTGIGDISGLPPAPHDNSSRLAAVSEFMRQLPLDAALPGFRVELERACGALDARLRQSSRDVSGLLIDHDRRAAILAEHAAGNRAVAQRHFGRDDLFMAPVPGPDAPLAKLELPESTDDLMREFVAPFVLDLIGQHRAKSAAEAAEGGGPGKAGPRKGGPGKGRPGGGKRPGGKGRPGGRAMARAANEGETA